ncbi:extracellular solute-binding protein [Granulosicoccus antarcticus]|uniref:Lactose-binding protein n=1 Tax=Granulosicoccus antarcticus IMCC3135 TaxID=1192854 RepID=A0A2Z2NHI1_9GAMM|nr:extracellular solute-binding protein [Granulosicoccus antarcticus]ASJ70742.1 Lactose-binding protein [Granulosicoccus antarcticus IMCC3135]
MHIPVNSAFTVITTAVLVSTMSAPVLAADPLRVVYRASSYVTAVMEAAETQFEGKHPGVDVVLEPITASSRDYATKVALMNQSASTAADIIYEDGFSVTADAAAGYLENITSRVDNWEDWSKFNSAAKQNGMSFIDGEVYSLPMGTDTQGIWYNKKVFAEAGLPTDWQPSSWADISAVAATIKSKLPDVTPLNIYVTKASGEASTMRGLLNLISGTPGSLAATFMDPADNKWVIGSQGFRDALTFLKSVYDEGYLVSNASLQDPNLANLIAEQMLPEGKVAMSIDGSWIWSRWTESGNATWEGWNDEVGIAMIPTQNGETPGYTSMSGGWTLAMSSHTPDKDLAFDFLTTAVSKENSLSYAMLAGAIAVRDDLMTNSDYLEQNPTAEFFSGLVQYTNFRPALELYPQVSSLVQQTMEAVTVGGESVDDALSRYDSQLTRMAGKQYVKGAE